MRQNHPEWDGLLKGHYFMKRILITGSQSFIGYNLYQWLRRNYDNELDIWGYSTRNGQNILNYEQLQHAVKGMDAVIHLAAETHVDKSISGDQQTRLNFIEINYKGTWNVLEATRQHHVKMIYISSSEVYGANISPGIPMTEDHPLNPQAGTYAVSKCAADHECRIAHEIFGQDVVILRPFNQYGPHQSVDKLIPKFISCAMRGEPLTVHGSGEQRRDYVYAEDTASAIYAALEFPSGSIVNIGTGTSYSVNDIAHIIMTKVASKFPSVKIHIKKDTHRPNDLAELNGSHQRIYQMCGWKPSTNMEEGILKCVDWYTSNGYIPAPRVRLI